MSDTCDLTRVAKKVVEAWLAVVDHHHLNLRFEASDALQQIIREALCAARAGGREEMREEAARLIDENDEWSDTRSPKRGVSPRTSGNLSGLGYAAAIRAIPIDPPKEKENG